MKYKCNAQLLCTPSVIAHFGDIIELNENDSYTKTIEAKNLIIPVKDKKETKKLK